VVCSESGDATQDSDGRGTLSLLLLLTPLIIHIVILIFILLVIIIIVIPPQTTTSSRRPCPSPDLQATSAGRGRGWWSPKPAGRPLAPRSCSSATRPRSVIDLRDKSRRRGAIHPMGVSRRQLLLYGLITLVNAKPTAHTVRATRDPDKLTVVPHVHDLLARDPQPRAPGSTVLPSIYVPTCASGEVHFHAHHPRNTHVIHPHKSTTT
jgi:hypothetical protein